MRIFGLNILTDKQLERFIEESSLSIFMKHISKAITPKPINFNLKVSDLNKKRKWDKK